MANELYQLNANEVFANNFRNSATGVAITDATMKYDIYDPNDNAVPSASAVAMVHTAAGNYRGQKPASIPLTLGVQYRIVIYATNYDFRVEFVKRCTERGLE